MSHGLPYYQERDSPSPPTEATMTAHADVRRLYKSRTDRMLDGVCGGIAEFFRLDSTLVRIAWVLLTLMGGMGILLYLVALVIMPTNPHPVQTTATHPATHDRSTRFWGILLIAVGTVWFLGNIGFPFWHDWWGFSWDVLLPVLLVLAGVAFIFGGRNSMIVAPNVQPGEATGTPPPPQPVLSPRLYRSRTERKMFGICGGIGTYFNIDPTIVRLLFIIAAFASFGFMILLYILMVFIVPEESLVVGS